MARCIQTITCNTRIKHRAFRPIQIQIISHILFRLPYIIITINYIRMWNGDNTRVMFTWMLLEIITQHHTMGITVDVRVHRCGPAPYPGTTILAIKYPTLRSKVTMRRMPVSFKLAWNRRTRLSGRVQRHI